MGVLGVKLLKNNGYHNADISLIKLLIDWMACAPSLSLSRIFELFF